MCMGFGVVACVLDADVVGLDLYERCPVCRSCVGFVHRITVEGDVRESAGARGEDSFRGSVLRSVCETLFE